MSFESSPSSLPRGTETAGTSSFGCVPASTADKSPESSLGTTRSAPTCSRVCVHSAPTSSIITPVRPEQFLVQPEPALKECAFCRRVLPVYVFAEVVVRGVPFRYRYCNQCRHKRSQLLAASRANLSQVRA
jgi:hypothetical protein